MRVNDLLFDKVAAPVAAAALVLALASMSLQVVFRYLLDDSLVWAEEVARYSLVWSSMLGAAVAYRRLQHVAVTEFVALVPAVMQRLIGRVATLLAIGFGALLAWQGMALCMRNFARNQLSTALQIDIAWMQLSIPVAGLLLIIAGVEALTRPWQATGSNSPIA